jgi:hypothetical protein
MRGADDFGGATVQPAQSPNNESSGPTQHYSAEPGPESDADDHNTQHSERYSYDGEEGDTIPEVASLQPQASEDVTTLNTQLS